MGELKDKTLSGVKWNAIGRFSTQGISFVISVLLARILSPSDYGVVGMIGIFMAIAQTFIDSGFGSALIRKKDYIAHPKENGYRSLHLVLAIPIFLSGGKRTVRVEVQIRTIAMDLWASLEHDLHYKGSENLSSDLADRLKVCAETLQSIDGEMQEIYREIKGITEYSKVHYIIH